MYTDCFVTFTRDVPQRRSAKQTGISRDGGLSRNCANGCKFADHGQRLRGMLNLCLLPNLLQLLCLKCENWGITDGAKGL